MKRENRTTPYGTLLGSLALLVIWQAASFVLNRPILPPPTQVVPLFLSSIFGDLGLHFLASTARVLAAIAVAVVTAAPLGLALGQMPKVDRMIGPLVAILYPIPKIIFLPVIYVLMGITDLSKITLIAIIIFFQILVVVRDEAAGLRPELIVSVRSLGAGRKALFRYVYLPASIPAVLTALRVSVGTAVAVLFIAEQSLTQWGLGYYIVIETYQVLMYPEMYTGIMAMGLLGASLYMLIHTIEARFAKR
ncbi:MAG: ABC transporter permease subunit [Desulfobacterales bacterium]|nr:ABC transporter permease subunit [Desulfobacterales bacterium]